MKTFVLYEPGDIVYAISFHNGEKESPKDHIDKIDKYERNYARIYRVEVSSVMIGDDRVEYWLTDPNTQEDWGDYVPEEQVNSDYHTLCNYLIKRWKL